jgi:hypothetical protein
MLVSLSRRASPPNRAILDFSSLDKALRALVRQYGSLFSNGQLRNWSNDAENEDSSYEKETKKKPAPKPPTIIGALRAAMNPVRKKSKRNQVSPYRVNGGRLGCRDFGLI